VETLLAEEKPGLMLLDLTMPGLSGEEILERVQPEYPDLPIIIITGVNDLDTAVQCMRSGAHDYLVKPVEETRLMTSVRRALELRDLRSEMNALRRHMLSDELQHPEAFEHIVTCNRHMKSLFMYAETIAPSSHPVLITGETGVGKELFAKSIADLSGRRGEFVTVNAAGLDDQLFADTLFGHARGAYTGADAARPGLVEKAAHGTLFLDEIGDLSMAGQVKLLRLLQEHEYFPLGSDLVKTSTARVIVATQVDLDARMSDGRFRKDLFYRLQVHHIHVPPLRERLDDLSLLTDHFLAKAAASLEKPKPSIPRELLTLLAAYDYPGNVRELETMMLDAVSRHQSHVMSLDVFKQHMATHGGVKESEASFIDTLEQLYADLRVLPSVEHARAALVKEALSRSDGNQSVAARLLGLSQQSLNRWLKKHMPDIVRQ
jgi:DNA-binding NtrC family response regulator